MKKIFARLTDFSEYVDVSMYFDFETECNETGLNVVGLDRYTASFLSDDWKTLSDTLDTVAHYLDNLDPRNTDGTLYQTASEVLDDYLPGWENGKKRSSRLIHAWKEAIFDAYSHGFNGERARVLMGLYTGKKYISRAIRGVCQGDYAEIYFPARETPEENDDFRKMIEAFYFGTGAEVQIHDEENEPNEPDEISGFWAYIPIPYPNETEIKEYLAKYYGDKETTAEDVTLWIPKEKHTSVCYDYEIA